VDDECIMKPSFLLCGYFTTVVGSSVCRDFAFDMSGIGSNLRWGDEDAKLESNGHRDLIKLIQTPQFPAIGPFKLGRNSLNFE